MKKFVLSLCILTSAFVSKAQVNCNEICILGIAYDSAASELDVTVYSTSANGQINYPIVRVVGAANDSVGNYSGQFFYFAQLAGDTVVHNIPTSLTSLPVGFTGTVYVDDPTDSLPACAYPFPSACSAGIIQYAVTNPVSVFPNPASENITLSLDHLNNAVVTLYDATGKLIQTYSTSENTFTIDRNGLQSGMYFIGVSANGKRYMKKVVFK